MARLNVNPTRMELRRLKSRLKTAVRGHKLLKDKSDEMVRRFIVFIRENKELRERVESKLVSAQKSFMISRALMTSQEVSEAVAVPAAYAELDPGIKNVMGVAVPSISFLPRSTGGIIPYSFISTKSGLDNSVVSVVALLPDLIRLAEAEKTCNMLADEIEKTRRRVNALEYVMIPQLQETIRYIVMKLDENERGTLTRLMKVKKMIEEKNK